MSTHNIGFYEDLTKIIFELSSNIIKYAPYFFCCHSLLDVWAYSLPTAKDLIGLIRYTGWLDSLLLQGAYSTLSVV